MFSLYGFGGPTIHLWICAQTWLGPSEHGLNAGKFACSISKIYPCCVRLAMDSQVSHPKAAVPTAWAASNVVPRCCQLPAGWGGQTSCFTQLGWLAWLVDMVKLWFSTWLACSYTQLLILKIILNMLNIWMDSKVQMGQDLNLGMACGWKWSVILTSGSERGDWTICECILVH